MAPDGGLLPHPMFFAHNLQRKDVPAVRFTRKAQSIYYTVAFNNPPQDFKLCVLSHAGSSLHKGGNSIVSSEMGRFKLFGNKTAVQRS